MHCLGIHWNPFGTRGKCAWGLGASTHYEKCTASEPVGIRGKYAWGLGANTHYEKCFASEPVGTRWEPVMNVPGAWAPARTMKSALPRNPLEPLGNLW